MFRQHIRALCLNLPASELALLHKSVMLEMQAGGYEVQGCPQLHSEFHASLKHGVLGHEREIHDSENIWTTKVSYCCSETP